MNLRGAYAALNPPREPEAVEPREALEEISHVEVEDPRDDATERNNISTRLPMDTVRFVAEEAKREGIDPALAVAIAWKETLGGQRGPRWTAQVERDPYLAARSRRLAYMNPMQNNNQDRYIDIRMAKDAEWEAMQEANKQIRANAKLEIGQMPHTHWEYLNEIDEKFQRAREMAQKREWKRKWNVRESLAKLKENMARWKDEQTIVARYNGVGPKADKYAREVLTMRDYIRRHPQLAALLK